MYKVKEIKAMLEFLKKEIPKVCKKRILKIQKKCTVCEECEFEKCVPLQSSFCNAAESGLACGEDENCWRCEQGLICACDNCLPLENLCDSCKYKDICEVLKVWENEYFQLKDIECTQNKRSKLAKKQD